MDQDNPNGFVESERGIILNESLPEERRSPVEPAPKPPKKHEKKIVGFLLFLLVAGAVAFAATQIDYTAISDTIVGSSYEASDDLQKIIAELDLTDAGMRILKATRPELQDADEFNKNCVANNANSAVLGCYSSGRIYLYDIQRQELDGIRQTTLAHELLHAIWERMSDGERESLVASLQKVYKDNADIQKSMEAYNLANPNDELHARIGTQVQPDKLPEDLQKHYVKYFGAHSKMVAFYEKYHSTFVKMDEELEALKTEIEERMAIYNEKHRKYDEKLAQYKRDMAEYNAQASGGDFKTDAEQRAAREALLQQNSQIEKDYKEILAYANDLNMLIAEHNNKVIYTNNLMKSIDSNPSQSATNP